MSWYKTDTVRKAAEGRWLFVLASLAPALEEALRRPGRHVSCPVHGGRDGFRLFRDVSRTGGGICNTCGACHDGFALLMWLNGWDFRRCLEAVGDRLGVARETSGYRGNASPGRRPYTPPPWLREVQAEMEKRMARERAYRARLGGKIERIWNACVPFSDDSARPMRLYFRKRRLPPLACPDTLRFAAALPYHDEDGGETGRFPTIVCAIRNPAGALVTLTRTYLGTNGDKAAVGSPRKMMPVPANLDVRGAAIRLGEPTEGILGVAEGLETALSAYRVTGIPAWSTVNATLMKSLEVPADVHTVLVWADKDRSLTGENAARVLKNRLEKRGVGVFILLPDPPIPPGAKGIDWNDVLVGRGNSGFPDVSRLCHGTAGKNAGPVRPRYREAGQGVRKRGDAPVSVLTGMGRDATPARETARP